MVRRAQESERSLTVNEFDSQAAMYVRIKDQIRALEGDAKPLRDWLLEYIEANGDDETADGNLSLSLPEAAGAGRILRQRRVSQKVNVEKAKELLSGIDVIVVRDGKKVTVNLWERCAPPQPVLDEDELAAVCYEGHISEEEWFDLYDRNETYALVVKK